MADSLLRLLLDENIHIALERSLSRDREDQVLAVHVRSVGLVGASDRTICAFAIDKSFVVVTLNVRDFEKLFREHLHAGVVLIEDGQRSKASLEAAVGAAIEAILAAFGDPCDAMLCRSVRVSSTNEVIIEEPHWPSR